MKLQLFLATCITAASALLLPPALPNAHIDLLNVNQIAPLKNSKFSKLIPNRYIVSLKDGISTQDFFAATQLVADLVEKSLAKHPELASFKSSPISTLGTFSDLFPKALVITADEDTLEIVRRIPFVQEIENDQVVSVGLPEIKANDKKDPSTEVNAPWGLGRISHLDGIVGKDKDYVYYEADGQNVTVYVVDTGINIEHVEFEGRAVWGTTVPENDEDVDGNGHGTHVAGTIAGKKFGVAKQATVVAVKVLSSSGTGTMSDVVKGIEWAATQHVEKTKKDKTAKSVANMSLGGGKSPALDRAVDASVDLGLHFAVAAGNDNADACNYSPAASKKSITVLASTDADARAWFSNWGKCVDIGAPGHQILSAWIGSPIATNVISGTSMYLTRGVVLLKKASPHVAGVLAALISRPGSKYEKMDAKELKAALIDISIKNIITGLPPRTRTKNRLLFSDPPETHHHDDEEEPENIKEAL
ncbi:serine protease [Phlyctochytrium planicorne]|nr:serine protease [Phlyctochytrium planicorne]